MTTRNKLLSYLTCLQTTAFILLRIKKKSKGPYFTRVVRDSTTRLINLWPSVRTTYPLPSSMLRFTGIQSYSYAEQRKVETDVNGTTGIELATLQLKRRHTNRLSYVCYYLFTSRDNYFGNLGETTVLACMIFTFSVCPWFKNITCLSSLISGKHDSNPHQ